MDVQVQSLGGQVDWSCDSSLEIPVMTACVMVWPVGGIKARARPSVYDFRSRHTLSH
jgi:hypothetical protein